MTFAEAAQTDDTSIHQHIEDLVAEGGRLLHAREQKGLKEAEHQRMRAVEIELDRYWDLLRQRRGRSEAGLDPSKASMRDDRTVEGYEQ